MKPAQTCSEKELTRFVTESFKLATISHVTGAVLLLVGIGLLLLLIPRVEVIGTWYGGMTTLVLGVVGLSQAKTIRVFHECLRRSGTLKTRADGSSYLELSHTNA